jgi:hypothetical protein
VRLQGRQGNQGFGTANTSDWDVGCRATPEPGSKHPGIERLTHHQFFIIIYQLVKDISQTFKAFGTPTAFTLASAKLLKADRK